MRRGSRARAFVLATLLVVCSTLIGLVSCELVARFIEPTGNHVWPPHMKVVFEVDPVGVPGIVGPSRFEANSLGIRGDELSGADDYRILAVGGSTTECLFLDQTEAWPYLLQQTLNARARNHHTWVGNVGRAGATSRHHVIAMRYLPLREMRIDAVIVLPGVNDLSIRLSQDADYQPTFMDRRDNRKKLFEEAFKGTRTNPEDPFLKRTALWSLATAWLESFDAGSRGSRRVEPNMLMNVQSMYVDWRRNRSEAKDIRTRLPDLSSALGEYRRNLEAIVELANRNSIRLILMTQPTMWSAGLSEQLRSLLWLGGIGNFMEEPGKPYYSIEALERGMRQYNEELLEMCKRRKVECIDTSFLSKDTTVFYDDVHFNVSGARQLSEAVAEYLLSRPPFGARGQ
jgi:lysophospholipase L1-like esterase